MRLPQREELSACVSAYRELCEGYERGGRGVDPLCSDVGLEDPATVGDSLLTDGIEPV